ncbi:hypothetical protein [Melittangium boletus]|uniref:hypothetical protein n=1 Tax=Melittangium boletus TaxID=83453 RepID=UPI003DA49E84
MKKFLARLSLLGLFAGLAASSYAVPAAASADATAAYAGPTTNAATEVIIIIITDDYYWVEEYYYGDATAPRAPSADALTDAAFDR